MRPPGLLLDSRHRALIAVTVLQAVCGLFFIADVVSELPKIATEPAHPLLELAVVAALWLGSGLGLIEIRQLILRNRQAESSLRAASGAFIELLEESFKRWELTPSERDVALLSIKGLSVAEIAGLRESRSGTVKAQCAAVYRKAGVGNRAQLLSHFIEDLMSGLVLEARVPAGAE